MYRKIEPTERMTRNEASERYPDNYILICWDSITSSVNTGTVLYVGDDRRELFSLVRKQDNPTSCGEIGRAHV